MCRSKYCAGRLGGEQGEGRGEEGTLDKRLGNDYLGQAGGSDSGGLGRFNGWRRFGFGCDGIFGQNDDDALKVTVTENKAARFTFVREKRGVAS